MTARRIVDTWRARRSDAAPRVARMDEIRAIYEGEKTLPLPELNRDERAGVANLVAQGLDQMAMRVASQIPTLECPSLRPGFDAHDQRADARRRATLGWWEHSGMGRLLRKRARHLLGYACTVALVEPDVGSGTPVWRVRNPKHTFPSDTASPDGSGVCVPVDCVLETRHPLGWLTERWPERMAELYKGHDPTAHKLFDVIRWCDAHESVLVAVGPSTEGGWGVPQGAVTEVVLERVPNRAGRCPVVIAERIGLEAPQGHFSGIVGMYQTQALLMALSVLAVQKGIFPDVWWMERPGEVVNVKQTPRPQSGIPGVVKGADRWTQPPDPQFASGQMLDRLEYAMRQTAGLPHEFGGTPASGVRTGRRGAQVMAAAVDFPVQEAQEILAASLTEENRVAVAVAKGWFGGARKSFYVSWPGSEGKVDYTPDDTFDTDRNVVSYSLAGVDSNGLVIEAGQRIAMGTLSKRGFMEIDPLVPDPDRERSRITKEALFDAALSSVQAQAADPAGPFQPVDLARLLELVDQGEELHDAVRKVHEEAQARQATPVEPEAPETQPGLSLPGMGAEAPAAIPEPTPSIDHLGRLLGRLRQPQMMLPQEMAPR
jgi:hypothetical protein